MLVFQILCVGFYLTEESLVRIAVRFLGYNLIWLETLGKNFPRQKADPATSVAQRLVQSRSVAAAVATPHSAGILLQH